MAGQGDDDADAALDEVVRRIEAGSQPQLIGIDGLPCAGKSTLAWRLRHRLGLDCIYLDEFLRPERDWPAGIAPGFPFPYVRHEEFLSAILALASTGACAYRPFDWTLGSLAEAERTVTLSKPVIVEGVSALNPQICPLYSLRIFVASDRATTLEAAMARDSGHWERHWRELFLPSVDIYMATRPEARADMLIAGRMAGDETKAGGSP